jgi:hypothetical protein
MKMRPIISMASATLLTIAFAACSNPAHAGSVTYEILADTSGLIPGPGGLIDINLGVSFPPGSASVSVRVFNPITDGVLGAATPISGTAAGDLTTPGGVTANNTMATNELSQAFAPKSFFDVFVEIQGPEIGPGAVGPWSGSVFNLAIFDSGTGMESATLTVNPNVDTKGNPIVDGTIGIATSGPQVQVLLVPEPSSAMLLGLGLGAAAAIGRFRKRRAAPPDRSKSSS